MLYEYQIQIGGVEYPYYLSNNTENLIERLKAAQISSIFIVYDSAINKDYITGLKNLMQKEITCEAVSVNVSEQNKNIDEIKSISEHLLECGINRKSCIAAVGGGVLGNIAGLVAGLLFRGIKLVHIPTTVMAATDSVLSLKQAVNTRFGKNLVGMFYKPEMVFTDYSCILSLPKRDYNAGLAELVKNLVSVIPDHIGTICEILNDRVEYTFKEFNLFLDLSIKAKCSLLKSDMYEKKEGLVFEYGHTVGHAVEFLSGGRIRHGEGVAFGLMVEGEISKELGYLKEEEVNVHYKLLSKIGITKQLAPVKAYSSQEIWNVMKHDNKRGYVAENEGSVPMVLLKSLGKCCMEDGNYIKLIPRPVFEKSIQKVFDKIFD
ncbi:MAG: 2-deoxy-scyllo-inosose synthase [Bacillota bacterium]